MTATMSMLSIISPVFISCVVLLCGFAQADPDNTNRCVQGKHHKIEPGIEGLEFKKYHCLPWLNRSCCTLNTSQAIQEDGARSLYNMRWDQCAEKKMSSACREWFRKDTCFYECSPNMGPWIVPDRRWRSRTERFIDVPLCASDCDAWFDACKDDLTCSDNWYKNWNWTKQGNMCTKECKTFKEYFKDSQNFCNNIFDRSFQYTAGVRNKECFSLWPNVTGGNPNDYVANAAEKIREEEHKKKDPKIESFLDRCLSSINHKVKPGKEGKYFDVVCVPWRAHSCCTSNTSKLIGDQDILSLYHMTWDHCGALSKKCHNYFIKDTCFYECSPNLAPWIVKDQLSKYTRKERFQHIPLCSRDCDDWFEACKDDYTCSGNWAKDWNWTKTGNQCKMECKRFKDYFPDPSSFCNNIFDHSFAYTTGKPGEDCMNLWPDSNLKDLNREVAYLAAKKLVTSEATQLYMLVTCVLIAVFVSILLLDWQP